MLDALHQTNDVAVEEGWLRVSRTTVVRKQLVEQLLVKLLVCSEQLFDRDEVVSLFCNLDSGRKSDH